MHTLIHIYIYIYIYIYILYINYYVGILYIRLLFVCYTSDVGTTLVFPSNSVFALLFVDNKISKDETNNSIVCMKESEDFGSF